MTTPLTVQENFAAAASHAWDTLRAMKKNDAVKRVDAHKKRAMNPLLAALEAKGLVSADAAKQARDELAQAAPGSATPGRASFAAVVEDALRRGAMTATSACSEHDVASVERAMGLALPQEYRALLLAHGPCVIATDPATTMTPLAKLRAVTEKWPSAHRDLRALRTLWPTIASSVLIADYLDDEAVSLLACQGEHAGKVFVVAHDADVEPAPDTLTTWLTTLLER